MWKGSDMGLGSCDPRAKMYSKGREGNGCVSIGYLGIHSTCGNVTV